MACYNCGKRGHIRINCPIIKCYICHKYGHISGNCPLNPLNIKQSAARSASRQQLSEGCRPWHGHSCRSRSSSVVSSASSQDSLHLGLLIDKHSNVRADEAVNRVAEAVARLLSEGPETKYYIWQNKLFQHLQEDGTEGLLHIPKEATGLDRGDFDVIVIHRTFGYIHIEVKATGDCQGDMTEEDKVECLIKVLQKQNGALKTLNKGREALRYLQPRGASINIISTLALPNMSRALLKTALEKDTTLREELSKCMFPTAAEHCETDVLGHCLCSDDLPPKNEVCEEHTRESLAQWWSKITQGCSRPLPDDIFNLIRDSFLEKEEVKSFAHSVNHTGEECETLVLNDLQKHIISSDSQYVFVSGPPGSGKTLVLAAKMAKFLDAEEHVFAIFKHGTFTTQPATELVSYFVEQFVSVRTDQLRLYKLGMTADINVEQVIQHMIEIKNGRCKAPGCLKQKTDPEDSDEITGEGILLEAFFTPMAIPDNQSKQERKDNESRKEDGRGMNVVIDELTVRTIKGKRVQLINSIQKVLPKARVWCAGPVPTYCPEDFLVEQLLYAYRCPPRIQRLLEALERFCRNEDSGMPQFSYLTSCTAVPHSPVTPLAPEERYRLPCEGIEPYFLSHAEHRAGEIIDCPQCADSLVDHLTRDLRIGMSPDLKESDVVIVLTGLRTYTHMNGLQFSELYRRLNTKADGSKRFQVNIFAGSTTQAQTRGLRNKGLSIMHVRAVAGIEKKVVVFVPCQQHQSPRLAPRKKTYAEALKHPSIAERLSACTCITRLQKERLARLGLLNLHWLWYAISRSSAHAVIFHF